MLNNKDYCDYETCVALEELGFPIKQIAIGCQIPYKTVVYELPYEHPNWQYCKAYHPPLYYEVQKWLRKEKGIFLDIGLFNDGIFYYCIRQKENNYWREIYRSFFHDGLFDDCGKFESYEEALSKGIKEAIKILKDGIGE